MRRCLTAHVRYLFQICGGKKNIEATHYWYAGNGIPGFLAIITDAILIGYMNIIVSFARSSLNMGMELCSRVKNLSKLGGARPLDIYHKSTHRMQCSVCLILIHLRGLIISVM